MRVIYVRYGRDLFTELLDENDVLVRSERGRVPLARMVRNHELMQKMIKEGKI